MQNRRKTFLVIGGILLCIVFLGIAFNNVTAKNAKKSNNGVTTQGGAGECTGCHEMKPEIATWQVSSHSKIPCTACHRANPADFQTAHDSQSFDKPIKMTDAIPNAVCEQCHSPNRVATPSGDLIIPHDKHAAAGVNCVKCHSGVAHAKIAERDVAKGSQDNNYQEWDITLAKQVSTKYYTQPSMWTCINCHKQANVTRQCRACHTTIPELPSHGQPTWKAEHGKQAEANIGECTKCHVTPGVPQFVSPSTGNKAADFARAQEFCYNCHLERPAMHEGNMVAVHPGKAAQKGVQNCLTCHNTNQPPAGAKVTGTYCNQCHWLQNGAPQPSAKDKETS